MRWLNHICLVFQKQNQRFLSAVHEYIQTPFVLHEKPAGLQQCPKSQQHNLPASPGSVLNSHNHRGYSSPGSSLSYNHLIAGVYDPEPTNPAEKVRWDRPRHLRNTGWHLYVIIHQGWSDNLGCGDWCRLFSRLFLSQRIMEKRLNLPTTQYYHSKKPDSAANNQ